MKNNWRCLKWQKNNRKGRKELKDMDLTLRALRSYPPEL